MHSVGKGLRGEVRFLCSVPPVCRMLVVSSESSASMSKSLGLFYSSTETEWKSFSEWWIYSQIKDSFGNEEIMP
jgi:hypothetical protein